MSTIASLNINLGLASGVFTKGIKRAQTALGSFTGQFTSLRAAIAGAAAAIGAGMMVNSLKNLTQESMQAIDVNAKMADKLGIATDYLVGFQHAANLAGSSTASLNKGLQFMSKNIGLAAMGAQAQAEALQMIGLSGESLAAMRPEEAFLTIAEAIKNTENPYQRLAAAQAIFGKGAGELLNTLMLGRDGLMANKKEAEGLGLAYSRVDAAKVEAANDAMTRVSAAFTGLGNQLAIQLAPMIEFAATKFVAWATEGNRAARIVTAGVEWMIKGIGFLADMIQTLNVAWLGMKKFALDAFAGVVDAISVVADSLSDFGANFGMGFDTAGLNKFRMEAEQSATAAGKAFEESLTGPAWSKRVSDFFDEMKRSAEGNAQAIADEAAGANKFGEAIPQTKAPEPKTPKPIEIRQPEAIGKGIAASFLQQAKRERSEADRVAKLAEQSLAEQRRQTGLLDNISDNLEAGDDDGLATATF
jgi:hypothetical protein